VLLELDRKPLKDPIQLDRLLSQHQPLDELVYKFRRGRDRVHTGELALGARSELRAEQLGTRKRGETGFPAPAWYGWAWNNLDKKAAPPSPANTAGKVVVIHAFQSW